MINKRKITHAALEKLGKTGKSLVYSVIDGNDMNTWVFQVRDLGDSQRWTAWKLVMPEVGWVSDTYEMNEVKKLNGEWIEFVAKEKSES